MSQYPVFPLWTDAYFGDTRHLTTIEHGAYLLLLMTAWRTQDCCLPNDDKLLARYAGLSPAQWKKMKPTILHFFKIKDGKLFQLRLNDEREAVKSKSKKAKANAKARWLKNKNNGYADAMQTQCGNDATLALALALDNNKENKQEKPTLDEPSGFDVFYKAYPKKTEKKNAEKKYDAIVKNKTATHDQIMSGLKNYLAHLKKEEWQKPCGPAVWLNGERWNDEYEVEKKSRYGKPEMRKSTWNKPGGAYGGQHNG